MEAVFPTRLGQSASHFGPVSSARTPGFSPEIDAPICGTMTVPSGIFVPPDLRVDRSTCICRDLEGRRFDCVPPFGFRCRPWAHRDGGGCVCYPFNDGAIRAWEMMRRTCYPVASDCIPVSGAPPIPGRPPVCNPAWRVYGYNSESEACTALMPLACRTAGLPDDCEFTDPRDAGESIGIPVCLFQIARGRYLHAPLPPHLREEFRARGIDPRERIPRSTPGS